MLSADKLGKQFQPRSGPEIDSNHLTLKDIFVKVNIEKKQVNYPICKKLLWKIEADDISRRPKMPSLSCLQQTSIYFDM